MTFRLFFIIIFFIIISFRSGLSGMLRHVQQKILSFLKVKDITLQTTDQLLYFPS